MFCQDIVDNVGSISRWGSRVRLIPLSASVRFGFLPSDQCGLKSVRALLGYTMEQYGYCLLSSMAPRH